MTIGVDVSIRNAWVDALTTRAGASALLRIYTATRPATGAAVGGATLLAELTCNATFAPAGSGGVLTLNAIAPDTNANATGTAAWFRIVQSNGTTFVLDGSVGTSAADLILNSLAIAAGAQVSISSFTVTAPHA